MRPASSPDFHANRPGPGLGIPPEAPPDPHPEDQDPALPPGGEDDDLPEPLQLPEHADVDTWDNEGGEDDDDDIADPDDPDA
ncbi:hypothetical protein [Novacetimonas pomaceti]|uniref:Uncharacterized protein n=1 Tax=Novacetimonas pomaceti TaxID=2021998 RepID=A0A318QSC4_9PROT|nr:hypothetical protein [Novacetimonas pomaceti]MBV1835171.1 hypothetical protein [Novacetimonas pomaceti]PYD49194.1 hypothetical protein C3920_00755 [Novacetimonas pomaceti]PYD75603.1 hypothetical protein CFR71_08505 [Novacetimonas pomaceti]